MSDEYPELPHLSDEQKRCLRVICSIAALHNLNRTEQHDEPYYGVEPWGTGVRVRLHARGNGLATYDGDALTRLVIASHLECVRIELNAYSRSTIEITAHPRTRGINSSNSTYERHSDADDLIDRISLTDQTRCAI